jgi:hypothetical protein
MKSPVRFDIWIPALGSLFFGVPDALALEQKALIRFSLTRESGVTEYELLSGGEVRKKISQKINRSIRVPAPDFDERIRPALQEGLLRLQAHAAAKGAECLTAPARVWVQGVADFRICEDDPEVRKKIIDRARAFEFILSQKE